MKSLHVLLFCVVVIVATVNGEEMDPRLKEFLEFHKECQKSTNTDPEEVAKLLNGEPINPKLLGSHVFCVQKKLHVQNDSGDFDIEAIRKILEIYQPQEGQVDLVIKNCTSRKEGDTPEDSAVDVVLCAGKYFPIKIPANINPF